MPLRETLIAELVFDDTDSVTLKNPMVIVILGASQADPNVPEIGLAPWEQFSADDEVVVDKQQILAIMNPIEGLKNEYNAAFGSGIVTASQKIILPGR